MPVAEFQGKWEVKIFVNKNFVVNKYFTIGKKIKTYTKAKTSITIGFAPYWNSDMSTQKVKGIHPNRILVYQKLYKDLKDKIHHLE